MGSFLTLFGDPILGLFLVCILYVCLLVSFVYVFCVLFMFWVDFDDFGSFLGVFVKIVDLGVFFDVLRGCWDDVISYGSIL